MDLMRFSVDSYEIIANNPSFMVLQIDLISDGINRHGTEFIEEDMVKSIPHLYNKPLNAIIKNGDFSDHAYTKEDAKKQLGLGTIPETNDIKIVEKKGKKFLRTNAIIWKYLYPEASNILTKRKEVAVSVEIRPLKIEKLPSGVVRIKEWVYEAITLLGRFTKPAIEDADAKVLKYSSNEDYFDETLLKYGVMIDKIIPPNKILEFSNKCLTKEINSIEAIKLLEKMSSEYLTFADIQKMNYTYNSLNDEVKKSIGGDKVSNWLNNIISEKEGGHVVDKIKEFLINKFSDNLSYVSHNDTEVFCFDYISSTYKSFSYSTKEEDNELEVLELSEEFKTVVKLSESGIFVEQLEEGQTIDFSANLSIEKFSKVLDDNKAMISELEKSKEEVSTDLETLKLSETDAKSKLADSETKITELELEKKELNEKIISYSELEKELVKLRLFKEGKEKSEKTEIINSLYSKYEEFLTDEDIVSLNEKSKDLEVKEFEKELYSIVMPKAISNIEVLKSQNKNQNDGGSSDNLLYTTFPKNTNDEEVEKKTSLLSRIKNI